ncbi:hypothetical protein CMI47_09765 [Candidatus Pacearchaeota archaeon]|nr:hypothetical protein [Candidatus Pacearchaeota archaeon]
MMKDFREDWLGWNLLPIAQEGNTGKYLKYQTLLYSLVKSLKPNRILEIGFNAGHSACCFLNASPDSKMITFDICRWGTEESAKNVLKNNGFDITLIKGDSTTTVPKYFKENPKIKFDLIFIDGYHKFDPSVDFNIPYEDMNNTKDYINSKGIFIIDDMSIGTVSASYSRINWDNFENISFDYKIEKNIKILRKIS